MNNPPAINQQRFDIDHPVPLDSLRVVEFFNHAHNRVSRIPLQPRRPTITMVSLAELTTDEEQTSPLHVIGVVVHPPSCVPLQSRGRDHYIHVRLADSSLPEGLSLMFFAREPQQLPPKLQQGDVLFIQKGRLTKHEGAPQLQCSVNAYAIWALFPGDGLCRTVREQLSLSVDDLKLVIDQRKWWRDQRVALMASPPQLQIQAEIRETDDSTCYTETILEESVDQPSGTSSSGGVAVALPGSKAKASACPHEVTLWLPFLLPLLNNTLRTLERHLLVANDHLDMSTVIFNSLNELSPFLIKLQPFLDPVELDRHQRQIEDFKQVFRGTLE